MTLRHLHHQSPGGMVLLPGDTAVTLRGEGTVVMGDGLRQITAQRKRPRNDTTHDADSTAVELSASICGFLRRETVPSGGGGPSSDSTVVVERYDVISPSARRYTPRPGDVVVGVVLRAGALDYAVHIGSVHTATLSILAFDGASKYNRPKLEPGDLVYAHVVSADRDADPELSCCAYGDMPVKDWATGEATFGPLKGGASVAVPLQVANDLIRNLCPVLMIASARGKLAFEAVIGVNGRVWLSVPAATSRRVLIGLVQLVAEAHKCSTAQDAALLVEKYFPRNE